MEILDLFNTLSFCSTCSNLRISDAFRYNLISSLVYMRFLHKYGPSRIKFHISHGSSTTVKHIVSGMEIGRKPRRFDLPPAGGRSWRAIEQPMREPKQEANKSSMTRMGDITGYHGISIFLPSSLTASNTEYDKTRVSFSTVEFISECFPLLSRGNYRRIPSHLLVLPPIRLSRSIIRTARTDRASPLSAIIPA